MIDAFIIIGAAAPWAAAWWGMRQQRDMAERNLGIERAYSAKLQNLLMAREAPAEYAAYIEPKSLAEEFPEDALWDDSGLYYVVPE